MGNRLRTAARRSAEVHLVVAGLVLALGLASSASATLLNRGPNLVYDDVLNITWTRNANLPGSSNLTWTQANAWAANLVFAGFDDWRLPYASVTAGVGPATSLVFCQEATEPACRDNEMGYMFYQNLGGLQLNDKRGTQTALGGEVLTGIQDGYWSGTAAIPGPIPAEVLPGLNAFLFFFGDGVQFDLGADDNAFSAWAVRAGDVGAALEPQTYSLLLAGLGWLGWRARRR